MNESSKDSSFMNFIGKTIIINWVRIWQPSSEARDEQVAEYVIQQACLAAMLEVL